MNYQQVQKIEVIVRKEGGNGEKGNKTTEAEDAGKQNGEQSTSSGVNTMRRKRAIIANSTHAFAVSKQWLNAEINYSLGGLAMQNGDEAYEDRVKRQVEVISDTSNIITSIGMGVTYGSFGGIGGMIAGGLFGLVSSGVSTIYKYRGRHRDFNFKMFKENNAIEYKRARANINLTTGRLR